MVLSIKVYNTTATHKPLTDRKTLSSIASDCVYYSIVSSLASGMDETGMSKSVLYLYGCVGCGNFPNNETVLQCGTVLCRGANIA